MAVASLIHIVCSDRHRNGKTLLARVLVDYLMLDGRDPFIIDADFPEGPLRAYFPGRTALVDFDLMPGRMKLFDTILASPGRDYVIDLPATQRENFFEAMVTLRFIAEARKAGFRFIVLFLVDRDEDSLKHADTVAREARPELMAYVRNQELGSALEDGGGRFVLTMPALDPALKEIIASRRFSLRRFLLGDEAEVPATLRSKLKSFLYDMLTGFRDMDPAMSLARLKG